MNRTLLRTLTWLMWIALPLTALRFWSVWDQLPARMATHFDMNWRPNGWMPRETAFWFAIGITALILVVFTVILLLAQRQKSGGGVAWVMLAFFYFIVAFVYSANDKVVTYNLTGQPVNLDFWMLLLPPAIILFIAFYLQSTRGDALPPAAPLAEETHDSPLFGALLVLAGILMLVALAPARDRVFLLSAAFIFLLLFTTGIAAWSGFHYLFSNHGLEIRTLGFRLRSIPTDQIQNYDVGAWNLLRGYGIRGIGDCRAYVWGNKGVQIKTAQGTVFLGHSHPEKIIRDLDMITHRTQELKK